MLEKAVLASERSLVQPGSRCRLVHSRTREVIELEARSQQSSEVAGTGERKGRARRTLRIVPLRPAAVCFSASTMVWISSRANCKRRRDCQIYPIANLHPGRKFREASLFRRRTAPTDLFALLGLVRIVRDALVTGVEVLSRMNAMSG